MKKPVKCDTCGSNFHYTSMCPRNQKPLARTPLKRSTKPIAKIGKQGKKTAAAVAKWKKTQTPNHEGYFICYICKRWIPYLVAEHVKSKARHPELRTDLNNLKPTCDDCNRLKGSKDN